MTKPTEEKESLHETLLPEDESYPTQRMIKNAKWVNRGLSIAAMLSLGMLAALITHRTLEDANWHLGFIVTADVITLVTGMLGKAAIMLYFNETPVIEGFKKICRKQLPDYFKLSGKTTFEKAQRLINFLLSLNAAIFWSMLVKISFDESADLFKKFDTSGTNFIGSLLQKWYVYLPFLLSSFYINISTFPSAHTGAYQTGKNLLSWIGGKPWKSNPEKEAQEKESANVNDTHRRVLSELKNIITGKALTSPVLDSLLGDEESQAPEANDEKDFQQCTLNKLDRLLALEPKTLRERYLEQSHHKHTPLSKKQKGFKYGLALGITGAAVYGWRNNIGLSHVVWRNLGAENLSRYLLGYVNYFSSSIMVTLTVFPLICNLFDVARQGKSPYVFSSKKFAFIISMVFFVGIFGGLANAEQSYLDNESTFDIINADISSFLIDAFSIFNIFKKLFESNIMESSSTEVKKQLEKRFVTLQALGQQAQQASANSAEEKQDHYDYSSIDNNSEHPLTSAPFSTALTS